ncbi:MAG: AI-2E family transporter [Patescibacteria group bacterium]|nr:AI-2E family transporter [Patescibacteria group bacterium]
MNQSVKLDISIWSIVKVFLVGAIFYLLFLVRDIIALFFIVLVFAAAFRPIINRWERKIGRIFSVLALLVLIILAIVLVVYLIVPPVISQSRQLIQNIPDILDKYSFIRGHIPSINEGINTFTKNIGNITNSFVLITAGIFGGVIAFFAAIVMTIYLLLDKNGIPSFIRSVVSPNHQSAVMALVQKITQKVGNWFRGQMALGAIIGVLDLIGLLIIGVPYALTLAVVSAVMEIIPTIGPLVSGLIAILITLSVSPIKALFVLILYVIVQQIENSFIVPKVMQKAVGLSPVVIILAILTGAKLLGVVGAILAVPIAASISVVVQEWPTIREVYKNNE